MPRASRLPAICLVLAMFGLTAAAPAAYRDVGSPYATIQDAIDAADDGDIVRVPEGTYHENVIVSKTLSLEGGWTADFDERDWEAHRTVLDGSGAGSVVEVSSDRRTSVTVEGFTIRNGDATGPTGMAGGGIRATSLVSTSVIRIRHNIIEDNVANSGAVGWGFGGGVHVFLREALIENNVIRRNVGSEYLFGEGGGVFLASDSAIVRNNLVTSNVAMTSAALPGAFGYGGGMFSVGGECVIEDNVFEDNAAALLGNGVGGGFYGGHEVSDNVFRRNAASLRGTGRGGAAALADCDLFANNLLEDNIATDLGEGTGGGIHLSYAGVITSNVLRNNRATRGGGAYCEALADGVFLRNHFERNDAAGTRTVDFDGGGGLWSASEYGTYIENVFTSNTATQVGGGAYLTTGLSVLFLGNRMEGNSADWGGGLATHEINGNLAQNRARANAAIVGGGFYHWGKGCVWLEANEITDNTAFGFLLAGGGVALGLDNVDGATTLTNNLIARNATGATGLGAGVAVGLGKRNYFSNNTIVDNNRGPFKDGLVFGGGSEGSVYNNIFAGHTTATLVLPGSFARIDSNDYFDNGRNTEGPLALGPDNIVDDPLFLDRAGGDYHIPVDSPCVDKALANSELVWNDIDGDLRPRGVQSDIGADEAYPAEAYVSALIGDDLTGDGSPESPFATVGKGLAEVGVGGAVYVARGDYPEKNIVSRGVRLLGGYDETDWSRDIDSLRPLLDGEGTTGSILIIAPYAGSTIVEGFRIANGFFGDFGAGAGVYVASNDDVVLRDNLIENNRAGFFGGGVAAWGSGLHTITIENCVIRDNEVENDTNLGGGGVGFFEGPITLRNNFIYRNRSVAGGDGVYGRMGVLLSMANLLHNSFADNGDDTSSACVELVMYADFPVDFRSNLLVGHTTGVIVRSDPAFSADLSIVADYNGFGDVVVPFEGVVDGGHNLSIPESFVDRAGGDLHLVPDSYAQFLGDPDLVHFAPNDIDGDPRPWGLPMPAAGADETLIPIEIRLPLLGVGPYNTDDLAGADLNGDGKIDIGDLIAVIVSMP